MSFGITECAPWMLQPDKLILCPLDERRLKKWIQSISEGTKQITAIFFLCIKPHLHDAQTSKTAMGFLMISSLFVSRSTVQI